MPEKKETICHILVVDDDTRIRTLLSDYLKEQHFIVSTAQDGIEARALLETFSFDLLIVDVMMPGETGFELTSHIRETSNVPILMLTARGETEDRITGLTSGADDYLAKPFDPRELLLRIKGILARTLTPVRNEYRFGTFIFDEEQKSLKKQGESVYLTDTELMLLTILLENQGEIVSRETLVEHFGDMNERSIDVQITRLRNKIEENPKKPVFLRTVRGKGYVFR